MTEAEIMKALEDQKDLFLANGVFVRDALDLINRKNAENERLKRLVISFTNEVVIDSNGYYIKELSYDVITANAEKIRDELNAEAIKEFLQKAYKRSSQNATICFFKLKQIAKEMGVEL